MDVMQVNQVRSTLPLPPWNSRVIEAEWAIQNQTGARHFIADKVGEKITAERNSKLELHLRGGSALVLRRREITEVIMRWLTKWF